jgi:hypothetical protein
MKKILVVLLVLAVVTGVFAQEGEWSLGGKAEIGFYTVLDPVKQLGGPSGSHVPVWGDPYNHPYNGWDMIHGQLGIGYTKGDAKVGLAFNYGDGDPINGNFAYNGENFRFAADVRLTAMVSNDAYSLNRLWGDYKFINGMVTLEVAYNSRDINEAGIYASDMTGALVRHVMDNSVTTAAYTTKWSYGHAFNEQPFAYAQGHSRTFVTYDHSQYIWADLSLENLSFGVFVPNLFGGYVNAAGLQTGTGTPNTADGEFVNDSLKQSLFGVKFTMQPVEVAAQFKLDNYGVYFGGKFNAGPITAGLSFSGVLGNNAATKDMRFGGTVTFNPEAFSAWVSAYYGMTKVVGSSAKGTQIGIEPGFFYNVIPTHFQFRTDIGFYFTGGRDATNAKLPLEIGWAVQPQIFWNFLGTGAGSYWGYGTGMIVRYRLLSDPDGAMGNTNALDVTFKWAF